MLQFTMLLCITIRDNFSGQKDVCSDGCIVFIVGEPSNRNYSQCDIENTQLEFGSALLYFEISQQMSTYK